MSTIKHIVIWKLHEQAEGADKATNIQRMKEKLLACADLVPGTLRFEVATAADAAAKGLEATYDVILLSEFADRAALDAYQDHPEHVAIKGFIGAVREARQCMDYES
ncbi:Dabb family protein [Corticibacter populi]|uniref:Dabb family protein n=1 Tax=Corticibacter populi TaxID=1550736 RepID=A0A3M6QME7_9BURK|nr:Dabb family protein [Corticibacter populi]RMX04258.1 Dabb family protein [Corticibacter populi]RZS33300.1 stress responsive alpha/beta barrel protein [Corticibacter populi]